ncbi:MAG TPA: tetratricopeptide repeat protein [Bryobacteraceae bacterium]|jgi:tetratricopeptide (TPR) repeat protein|nr:tetratricopeptide repeat protein [Bryobacteraceae bacterium]
MRRWKIAVAALILMGAINAQTKGSGTTPPPATGNTAPRSTQPNINNNTTTPFPEGNNPYQPPIFISGNVMLSDGTPLTDRAKIERVCNGVPIVETETDKKGRFNFEVGHSLELPDASVGSDMTGRGSPFGNMPGASSNMSNRMGNTDRRLWGCELRAALPGFRSDVIQLDTIHYMDNPNIGTIILHRLAKVDGLTISVVSALAPKDARKAYEKGREAEAKKKLDDAQKNFEKAVSVYPQYSAAWFELGRINEQSNRIDEARKAYQQAIAAEPKFVLPREQLSWLALREAKWQELVDLTDQWLQLDPSNSPDAYYLSSIGNLQMQHSSVAEKNAQEAVRMDPGKKNMRARYVLGLALAQNHDFTASADAIRSYLDATPDAKDRAVIQKQLEQIQEAAQEKVQSGANQPKPQ